MQTAVDPLVLGSYGLAVARLVRFWRDYLRRYAGWYLLGIVCLVATNVLTVSIPGFVKEAIDALDAGRGPASARPWAWAVVGAGLGVIVVRTLSRTLFFNPGRAVEFRLKNALFQRLLNLPRTFFDRFTAGEIISRGTNDTNAVRSLAGYATLQFFNVILMVALTLAKMSALNARLTLYCAAPLVLAVLVLRLAVRAMFGWTREAQEQIAILSDRILETYHSVGMLRAYGALAGAHARFDATNQGLLEIGLALTRIRAWLLPVISVVGSLTVVLVLLVGGRLAIEGALTIGDLAAFTVYVGILVSSLISLGWMINAMQRGWIALGRVDDVMYAPDERATERTTVPVSAASGPAVEVRNLAFGYDASEPVLSDLSFSVAPGEVIGVFGLTGAGKSTLLSILSRVRDAPSGTVFVDGVDVTTVPPRDHWRRLAYVTQEPFLFSRSVRANVTWRRDDESVDEVALTKALADAAFEPDLEVLPEGVDTIVGERGITLSGGQRQRVALARAFYRGHDLLLLDDVLSAVDHATEERLIDAIYARAGHGADAMDTESDAPGFPGRRCTTVIVSHRLSVLARADRVLVLEDGRLVDSGPHAELIRRPGGTYRRTWELQQAAARLQAMEEVDGG